MDKDKVSNQENIQKAAEQWANLVMMLIKVKRQQQKMANINIKTNYENR